MTCRVFANFKSPSSIIDYGFLWGASAGGSKGWLAYGEKIVSSIWTIEHATESPPLLVIDPQGSSISSDSQMTYVFLSGGTPNTKYTIKNTITTIDSVGGKRTETQSAILGIKAS